MLAGGGQLIGRRMESVLVDVGERDAGAERLDPNMTSGVRGSGLGLYISRGN